MKKILIITGPTASGKTDFAIKCAEKFNGEIISCDSMQIFKDLNIGTAKPTRDEQSLAKHYLIDIIDANEQFSVQQFVSLAKEKIKDIQSRHKLPIIVGGTGLYIKSLIYPYSFCSSPKNEKVREYYNSLLLEKGKEYIYNLLKEKDEIASNKIHMNDVKRVIRALEICDTKDQNKTTLNNIDEKNSIYDYILLSLNLPRDLLYSRINQRVDKMFELGLIDEIKALLKANKVDRSCQSMQAIGYKEIFKYLDNELTLEQTKELIKKNSRNYAKRQLTFIRGFKDAIYFNPLIDCDKMIDYIKDSI